MDSLYRNRPILSTNTRAILLWRSHTSLFSKKKISCKTTCCLLYRRKGNNKKVEELPLAADISNQAGLRFTQHFLFWFYTLKIKTFLRWKYRHSTTAMANCTSCLRKSVKMCLKRKINPRMWVSLELYHIKALFWKYEYISKKNLDASSHTKIISQNNLRFKHFDGEERIWRWTIFEHNSPLKVEIFYSCSSAVSDY